MSIPLKLNKKIPLEKKIKEGKEGRRGRKEGKEGKGRKEVKEGGEGKEGNLLTNFRSVLPRCWKEERGLSRGAGQSLSVWGRLFLSINWSLSCWRYAWRVGHQDVNC